MTHHYNDLLIQKRRRRIVGVNDAQKKTKHDPLHGGDRKSKLSAISNEQKQKRFLSDEA